MCVKKVVGGMAATKKQSAVVAKLALIKILIIGLANCKVNTRLAEI